MDHWGPRVPCHTCACMLMHMTGVGHVMQHGEGRVCDETLGVGPGLGGFGTGLGLSTERVITQMVCAQTVENIYKPCPHTQFPWACPTLFYLLL